MKKRKSRNNQPVLTSPWKIGIFVSLLLVLMSIGVGYYLVSFYNVDLKWIKSGAGGWSIDSTLFIRDMLPLAVAVIFVSLFAYFLIASAVHRYKFYLDSGQDYRTMISLAESIDDLTNPAQIARLSKYPQLQAVLRNYGDQIREISQDLGTKDNASNYSELKSEIEGLISPDSAGEDVPEEKDCGSIYEKLRDRVEADRARIEELEKRNQAERRAYGHAALAYGRAMEAISGAGEELLAITNSVAELTSVAERINANAAAQNTAAARRGAAGPQGRALKMTMSEMESSVRKLEEGGRVLHEFSEENNGIAIHLALMAARGNVDEHALATFAERVRSTAERFHKLSDSVSSIAQGLLGSCYTIKEKAGMEIEMPVAAIDAEVSGAIVEIARRIEERSSVLEKQIMNLGSELHEVHELLQKDIARAVSQEAAPDSRSPLGVAADLGASRDRDAGPAGQERAAAGDSKGSPDMLIDHGSSWKGISPRENARETEESEGSEEEGFSFKNLDEMKEAFAQATPESASEKYASDFSDMSSLRQLDGKTETVPEPARVREQTPEDGGLMKKPGHTWRKVEVEKTEIEDEAGQVDVTVKATAPQAPHEDSTTVFESVEEAPLGAEKNDDDETIHDLLDLGAVEYVKESQIRR
ncbi:MAG: hypothetical protein WC674_03365 [Candidatus Krumholzibacteriia bacterium]